MSSQDKGQHMINESVVEESTRPVGRILRLLSGAVLVGLIVEAFERMSVDLLLSSALIFSGITAMYILIHLVIVKKQLVLNPVVGACFAVAPAIAIYVLAGDAGEIAVITYIGISLILDAIRADLGCEVMAIPGILTGQRTNLCCLFFSPIDWVESRVRSALGR